MPPSRPFEPYRVLEIGTGAASWCARLLADLGADVIKVEPPEGDEMRSQAPLAAGVGISFLYYNANKRGTVLDLDEASDQALLREKLAGFDILIDGNAPGWLASHGLDPAGLRAQYPGLIIVSVTHFGETGPYRDWQGSSAVDMALSSQLLRCGLPDRAPVTAPYHVPYIVAGVAAASATAAAILERNHSGSGDWIDCSIVEACATGLDWSVAGAAAAGASGGQKRNGSGPLFRPFRTADGWLRIINLSARQTAAFTAWLGPNPEMQGTQWANPMFVGANRSTVEAIFARSFGARPKHELFVEAQERGVGAVPINSPNDALKDPHFNERGAFVPFPLPDGSSVLAVGGMARMDGALPRPPGPAPVLARELSEKVSVLVVANPVFGLDFAAVAEIHDRILAARNAGTAVLLVSEDLDELLELSDRMVVIFDGQIVHETVTAQADIAVIGPCMAGHAAAETAAIS